MPDAQATQPPRKRRTADVPLLSLHVHGEVGEYLPPIDRQRFPNPGIFEDFGVDFVHEGRHFCTYIPGKASVELPLGKVYVEVSKGFEVAPVRRVYTVTRGTREIVVEIAKVLPWRERGWVSADTHVHVISPGTATIMRRP